MLNQADESSAVSSLHVLSLRPDSTGSDMYIQAMIREAAACGYANDLTAGVQWDYCLEPGFIEPESYAFMQFHGEDLSGTRKRGRRLPGYPVNCSGSAVS